jgi:hypothetical protein
MDGFMTTETTENRNTGSRKMLIRAIWTIGLLGLVAGLWLRQGPLAYSVAQQRVILLGRYTVEQMTTQLFVTPIVLLIILGIWTGKEKSPQESRRDWFRTILMIVSILLTIVVVDIALRMFEGRQYIKTAQSHHRPPNLSIKGTFEDVPDAAFTFPNAPAGYPPSEYTLTTDKRGFRNKTTLQSCDAVILGDSFAEGCGISDESVWPVLLGQQRRWLVCNLAMSGTSPLAYLDILRQYGLALKPKIVICLLYEGNDFRDGNYPASGLTEPPPTLGRKIFYGSPLRQKLKTLMIRTMAPIGRGRFDSDSGISDPSHPMYAVSWLPLVIPAGGYPYAIEFKRVEELYRSRESLAASRGVLKTQEVVEQIELLCQQNNIRLIVGYAPDRAHVALPAMGDRLDADRLRAFLALKMHNLPAGEKLVPEVLSRLDNLEAIMEDFCRDKGIEFISLTAPLREAMLAGKRVYFTYDQHWSPEGHALAAEVLAARIP